MPRAGTSLITTTSARSMSHICIHARSRASTITCGRHKPSAGTRMATATRTQPMLRCRTGTRSRRDRTCRYPHPHTRAITHPRCRHPSHPRRAASPHPR